MASSPHHICIRGFRMPQRHRKQGSLASFSSEKEGSLLSFLGKKAQPPDFPGRIHKPVACGIV
jgi:hypothetical protein